MKFLNVTIRPPDPRTLECSFNTSQFAPDSVGKTLKKVHVVEMCHFDFGFTNVRWCVLSNYFNQRFPKVLAEIQQDPTVIYHTQPFLVFAFLNCNATLAHAVLPPLPPNSVTCPKPELVGKMKAAIKNGQIVWHAYDWDSLLELYGPNTIGLGTHLAKWLDAEFAGPNVTRKRVMSVLDVPGLAASNVPGLAKAGVEAIYSGHVTPKAFAGMPAMMFRWRVFGSEVVLMFHPQGYGGIKRKDLIYDEASGHGLLVAACLENSDPATLQERASYIDIIANELGVSPSIIKPSSFESFFDNVDASKLPVYEGEFGNDWSQVSMGDPKKIALLRAFGRAYHPPRDEAQPSVERLLAETFAISAGEHNFGVLYKSGGPWDEYSNHAGPWSWDEQRHMINATAARLLAEVDPQAARAFEAEVAQLDATPPSTDGLRLVFDASRGGKACSGPGPGVELGGAGWRSAVNCSGAIVSLEKDGLQLADASHPLAALVVPDKPMPVLQQVWADPHTGKVLLNAVSDPSICLSAGLPSFQHWLQIEFDADGVNVTVWMGKRPDEINGGAAGWHVYLHFNPAGAAPDAWVTDQQGIDVPVTFGGNCTVRQYQCVWSGMSHPAVGLPAQKSKALRLLSWDTPLVAFISKGKTLANILDMTLHQEDTPDLSKGTYWNLVNTRNAAWVRQYPWQDEDYWTKYRFALRLEGKPPDRLFV